MEGFIGRGKALGLRDALKEFVEKKETSRIAKEEKKEAG